MLKTSWADNDVQTVFGFLTEDLTAVLQALEIKNMPRAWILEDMTALYIGANCRGRCKALESAGISYNYAEFRDKGAMIARQSGQVRYGHDGTLLHHNLVHDLQLMYMYERSLRTVTNLDMPARNRICLVCCGQESWDNREENGQMHKLRNLLSQ